MAARKTAKSRGSRRPSASSRGGGSFLGLVLLIVFFFTAGVTGGYLWRSYYPVVLPFESRLVSDKTSSDLEMGTQKMIIEELKERAKSAEAERDQIAIKLKTIKEEHAETERELGDLRIKSVLQSRAE